MKKRFCGLVLCLVLMICALTLTVEPVFAAPKMEVSIRFAPFVA